MTRTIETFFINREGLDVGPNLHNFDDRLLFARPGLRACMREPAERNQMNFESVIGLTLAALLLIYLAYALLRPEKF